MSNKQIVVVIFMVIGFLVMLGLALVKCANNIGAQMKESREEQTRVAMTDSDGDGYCMHETECFDDAKPGDCSDKDAERHPGAVECDATGLGDGIDNDCDDIKDNGCLDVDNDNDGYCEHAETCKGDAKPGDCEDLDSTVHPGAPESHRKNEGNGRKVDNDCDGVIDNGTRWFDDDGDGYCESASRCNTEGIEPGDCDDDNPNVHPGEVTEGKLRGELLYGDGLDNNCDGMIDEGCVDVDNDGDGFCEDDKKCMSKVKDGCKKGEDECLTEVAPGDCNDANKDVYPGAKESDYRTDDAPKDAKIPQLDGIDNDCDGIVDNHLPWYDDDGDGYCEDDNECIGEALPEDCDDDNPDIHPGAAEGDAANNGDEIDNNCNGEVDEGTKNIDTDGDGVSGQMGDCDEMNPMVFKGQLEWFDGYDNDCDGVVDETNGLADVDDAPGYDRDDYRNTHKGNLRDIYEVYPESVWTERINGWSFDHDWSVATYDAYSGMVRTHHYKSESGSYKVYNRDDYKVVAVRGPDLDIETIPATDSDERAKRILLRFEQRGWPIKVQLKMDNVPRPSLSVTVGRGIDGLNKRTIQDETLSTASASIPSLELVDGNPEDTYLFFWQCKQEPDEEKCTYIYVGQYSLAKAVPKSINCTRAVSVDVRRIEVRDIEECRSDYNESSGLKDAGIEKRWMHLADSCTTVTEQYDLPFTLIFTR